MTIKIISNPYTREINFYSYKEQSHQWENIKESNTNSRLREDESGRYFLPFKVKEIIDTIISEYYISGNKINIQFEGTQDEYIEVENVCKEEEIVDKIELSRTTTILENARIIFEPTKDIFATVQPIIEKIVKDDANVCKDLNKVSDALKDIIPICVFGNYSAGKSTFINALIGGEVLPSGGDPVTAKVYKIERSKYPDNARVRFSYKKEAFEILFEGTDYHLLTGNVESELIQSVFNTIKQSKTSDMNTFVSIALELINGYEKKDKDDIVISNVIEVEIPFSKGGILGQSYNNFVIFDTPGSNSESNAEHTKVLEEALEGFSNGIPVWISTYESVDSTDNASLCERILNIKALDKRFTMIILNKADGSDLDEGGFSKKKEQEILEYSSVEKMYASGIYFVSSIMGLGAKNDGILIDKHYRKIYRSQQEMYNDPEDEDYATLYKYNIMPYQIKKNVEKYSSDCQNLIYANSGLYCVEQEMENFASKHAAYNKCQMVYIFLKQVIAETDKRIAAKTTLKKNLREDRINKLESNKADLICNIKNDAKFSDINFDNASRPYYKSFISKELTFRYEIEALEKITETLHQENVEDRQLAIQEKGCEDSKSKISTNAKKNVKEIFGGEGKLLDKLSKMKEDLLCDYTTYKEIKGEKNLVEKEIDKKTSDELLHKVIEEYKEKISFAQEKLCIVLREHWHNNSLLLKEKLIEITTGSNVLSASQQEELSKIIMCYQPISFEDNASNVFVKTKFLRGSFLGLQITDDEKINIRKLSRRYNDTIAKAVSEMASVINNSDYESFKRWEESLLTLIEENITKYNPDLRAMSDEINDYSDQINELESNQATIRQGMLQIEELMAWKTLE